MIDNDFIKSVLAHNERNKTVNDLLKINKNGNPTGLNKTTLEIIKQQKQVGLNYLIEHSYLMKNEQWQSVTQLSIIHKIGFLYKEYRKLKSEKKQNAHSRKVRLHTTQLGRIIKVSNQILGFVCYYTNYFTKTDVECFLNKLDIETSISIIREIGRYRNLITNSKRANTLKYENLSTKKIITKIEILNDSKALMIELKLTGVQVLNKDLSYLNNTLQG